MPIDNYNPPLVPGYSSSFGAEYAATPNPFFTVANQFIPRNLHDVIRWARYITVQSPVTTEVVRKLATYPITDFTIDTQDEKVLSSYHSIFKQTKLKSALHDIGFEYYTIGNVFLSIYFPIHRTLKCQNCGMEFNAKNAAFTTFKNYQFQGQCPKCEVDGVFIRKDTKSVDIKDVNLIKWDPTNITVNHNPITNEYEYYYSIPGEIKRKIKAGDKLFINSIPWGFVEAVQHNQDFKFDKDNVFHLRNLSAGPLINGIAIPPLISLFGLVFYQQTLRRGNEAIAQGYMTPIRAIFPQAQTGNSDPVISISMRNFASRMKQAFMDHKRDPNHIVIAPVPIGYQAISGEGKALLISQEIEQAEESILLSLGVSRELLSGQTNWTSSTVGLRLLRNTLEVYTSQIEDFIGWFVTRLSKYLTIPTQKVTLVPFKLTDDDELRQVMMNLTQLGKMSISSLLESFGLSYKDELDKMKNDTIAAAKSQVETKMEVDKAQFLAAKSDGPQPESSSDYAASLEKAQELASQLNGADIGTRRSILGQLRVGEYPMYLMVSKLMEEQREGVMADDGQGQIPGQGQGQNGDPGQGQVDNPGVGSAQDQGGQRQQSQPPEQPEQPQPSPKKKGPPSKKKDSGDK